MTRFRHSPSARRLAQVGICAAGILALGALGSPARATMVTPGSNPSEPSLYQLMNNIYGAGNWVQLDDSSTQTVTNGGQSITLNYDVRYASDTGTFGVFKDGTSFSPFMNVSGNTATPTSVQITPSMLSTNIGGIYSWGYKNDTTGQLFSGNNAMNADQRAHLIIFAIPNLTNTFVLAWEDMVGGDYDYNDLLLQESWVLTPTPVPEPLTISLLGSALILAAGARRLVRPKTSTGKA